MSRPERAAATPGEGGGRETISRQPITLDDSSTCNDPGRSARSIPFDPELGHAILGPSFAYRASAEHAIAVRADAWPTAEQRALAAAIRAELAEHDGPPDPILTARRAGVDLSVVHEMIVGAWSVSMVPRYCAELERDARLRRIVHRCGALSQAALESADDATLVGLFEALAAEVAP